MMLLLILLILCLIVGGSAVLGAPGVIVLPVGFAIAVVLLVGSVVGIGRSTRDTLRKTPKAELLGPGGPDDPDSGG
jgi:hypothetical protein